MTRTLFALVLTILPGIASAQQSDPSTPAGLNRRALSTVFVRDAQGNETKGKLLRLDPQSLVIVVDGTERRFELADVWSVQKRGDSLKEGAIAGAVVGVVLGLIASGFSECWGEGHYGSCGVGTRAGMIALSTGMYAAIGTGIDAAIPGRTTLYQAPRMATAAPAVGRVAAARMSLRW